MGAVARVVVADVALRLPVRASADDAEAVAARGRPHLPAGRHGGPHGCAPRGSFLRRERDGLA
eukprot:13863370-Heterocapsa_arctica.AAC.1